MSGDSDTKALREGKLKRLIELGLNPYVIEKFHNPHSPNYLRENYSELEGKPVSLAGRVTSLRPMGKAGFFDLTKDGERMQVYVRKDDIGDTLWEAFGLIDIGDIVGVSGELFTTKAGEISIHCRDLSVLAKCLHVLPIGKQTEDKQWYGLTDIEERYRKRYLDLIANKHSREVLIQRSKLVSETRKFLDSLGFLEVETPILEVEVGGAAARPFLTYHNALDLELKLRISLELHLKRLIIGGIEKVYEIGRVFRNEGISTKHNPEFTLLELYMSYANMEDIQKLVEELCRHLAKTIYGSEVIEVEGITLDFSKPWKRVDLLSAIEEHAGIKPDELDNLDSAKSAMQRVGLDASKENSVGGIIEKLLEKFVEPKLQEPTFVENYPIETSPLAKKHPTKSNLTRRFEGYIRGREVCNAFSELNDPFDQRERMERQHAMLLAGDHEANPLDEDFLYAMEIGMPPAGGLGIGMDRLAMIFSGIDSIRDVIFFPTLKPEHKEKTEE